jgi:hypothetical protein
VTLAVVHSLGGSRVRSPLELEDFEQELVDQFALAASAVGSPDRQTVCAGTADGVGTAGITNAGWECR